MNPESVSLPQQAPITPQSPDSQPVTVSLPSQDQNPVAPTKTSSKKPIIIFIIILLLGIGVFYYFMVRQEGNSTVAKPVNQAQESIVIASPSATPSVVNLDSSDTQLDKDIQAINNKANNLATDVNNVNTGLNDKPIDNGL